MTPVSTAAELVSVRSNNVDRYKRNFLRQAICELRFPTLMELGDPKPPSAMVSALRKDYPHLELANEVIWGVGGGPGGSSHIHTMRSSRQTWAISLKQSSLTIETFAYSDYAEMKRRVSAAVNAVAKVIDTNFFTRVGLRYINVIDVGTDPVRGWVNPDLVAPLLHGAFTNIREYAGKISLAAGDGGCLLQHGVRTKPLVNDETVAPEYFIDVDSFREDVPITSVVRALDEMHAQAFDVFDWAIGPKAREHLTAEKPHKKN